MVLSLRKFPLVLTYKYEGYMSFHGFDEGNHHGSQGSGSREWRRSHAVILHSAWRGSVLFHGLEPAWHLASHGGLPQGRGGNAARSEDHTSELQSLMRTSYAVFCLKKKINKPQQ